MRILYIASGTRMSGGATKSFLAMLCEADKAGIEYEVICPDEKGLTAYLKEKGIKVHVVHYRHACLPPTEGVMNKVKWIPRLVHNYWINLKARPLVDGIARRFSPDIIHENSSVIDVGFYAAKRNNMPDVVHIREYGDMDFKMRLPGRDRRLADPNVYTISITKDIQKHTHQDINPRGSQIYNGIVRDVDFRYDSDKKRFFLYAGRIEKAKGVSELLKAYVSYSRRIDNAYTLYMAGGCNYPSYLESLKSYLAKEGCGDKVIWLGDREDVGDIMAEATATIIPSRFEALGRVMPEAMANGCLCVGRNTGGTKEQMDNGREYIGRDIAISYETVEQLSEILLDISQKADHDDPFAPGGEYESMIQDAMKTVRTFFSEEFFGRYLIDFYKRIVSERPRLSS